MTDGEAIPERTGDAFPEIPTKLFPKISQKRSQADSRRTSERMTDCGDTEAPHRLNFVLDLEMSIASTQQQHPAAETCGGLENAQVPIWKMKFCFETVSQLSF